MHKLVSRAEWILHMSLEKRNKKITEDFPAWSSHIRCTLQDFVKICRWCDNHYEPGGWTFRHNTSYSDPNNKFAEISYGFKSQEQVVEFLLTWG